MKKFKDINRLKEDSMDSTTMSSPEGNQFRGGYTPASRTFTEKPQKEPMKKYKEVKEESEIDIPKDAPSVEAIAKKHGVSVAEIEKQLKIGMAVEAEHGKNKGSEREIAMDHLNEKPNYYTKLKKYVEETEVNEMLKPKMSALDKWRASATEREKMHNDIEKNRQANASQGKENMSDTITKLSKSLNKEEVEQIQEYESKVGVYKHKGTYGTSYKGDIDPGNPKSAEDSNHLNKTRTKNLEQGLDVHFGKISKVKEETEMKKDPCWHKYEMIGKKMKNGKKVPNCVPVKEAKDEQEYGYEGDMALNQLATLTRCADMIKELLKPDTDMPEWVQSKITLATDYIQTAADYMYSELKEDVDLEEGIVDKIRGLNYGRLAKRSMMKSVNSTAKTGSDEWNNETSKTSQRVAKAKEFGNKRPFKEEVEQIDEAPVVIKTNKEIGAKVTSVGPGGKETVIKTDPAYSKAEQEKKKIEEGKFNQMDVDRQDREAAMEKDGWKKIPANVTDKSGAKHSPMSRARDLARLALNKKAKSLKPVKEEKEESRKAGIVKNVVKSAKKKKSDSAETEKFESEPVLSSEIQKQ